ncbi:UNVERIFIED_CONTAM: hypothetical protein GTU68_025951 [Idotea baltica]|nr:hypothetical protein [Idotea baltica]
MKSEIDQAIKLLTQLVRTPSLSRAEDKTAQILQDFLEGEGIVVSRVANNVLATYMGTDPQVPYIMLCSHHDTVKPNAAYTRDPFDVEIVDGKLYGLGSNDAGASLVCLVMTFLHMVRSKAKINLTLAAVAEEEVSGSNGVTSILDGMPPIELAIVGEPTKMIDVRVNELYTLEEIVRLLQSRADSILTPRSLRLHPSGVSEDHKIRRITLDLGITTFGSATLSDQAMIPYPSIKMGPGDSLRSHTADEFVMVEEIEQGVRNYIKLLEAYINTV